MQIHAPCWSYARIQTASRLQNPIYIILIIRMFYCNICFTSLRPGDHATASTCGHIFCRCCFAKVLEQKQCHVCSTVRHICIIICFQILTVGVSLVAERRGNCLEGPHHTCWDSKFPGSTPLNWIFTRELYILVLGRDTV